MPNTYFRFKQFTINQDRCAMKVCTDACILGAWFAGKISAPSAILDIGSGTGLLMLMLAQKHNTGILGIEIDSDAFLQLKENIEQSPWSPMLKAFPGDARTFPFRDKFDFIITNPPFYEGQLPAVSNADNLARHSAELNLTDLLTVIDANLSADGSFGILLSYHRMGAFEAMAHSGHGFTPCERLLVRQTPRHDYFRSVLHFSRRPVRFVPTTGLTIQKNDGAYTEDFIQLMNDYYLHL